MDARSLIPLFCWIMSLCFFPFNSFPLSDPLFFLSPPRCRLSGGFGLSPGLGHAVLDQLHHLHHYPAHGRPEPLGSRWQAHGGHHVGRRPPPSLCLRWVPEVGASALFHFIMAIKFWDVAGYTARLIFAVNIIVYFVVVNICYTLFAHMRITLHMRSIYYYYHYCYHY